jgi:hypothetical protein
MVLRFLGIEKLDRQISAVATRDYFKSHKDWAALRLLTLLKPFDARLAGDLSSGVRISFLINTAKDAASTFSLVPVSPKVGWDENPVLTQILFVPREGRWPVMQYHGIMGKEWADGVGVFAPNALTPPRKWLANKGQIMPPWGELRDTLRDPAKRRWLLELLWRDKFPGRPLPVHRLLVASRNGESDAIPTRALDVLDATPYLNTDPPAHLARLFFVDDGGRDRLTGFDGRGGQDGAKAVLEGDGHWPTHPFERALVLGRLCRKHFMFNLSLQDVTGFFSQQGHSGIGKIVNQIAAADPTFPKDSHRFAIAAWMDGKIEGENKLAGLRLLHGDAIDRERGRNYALWVEYVKGEDSQWQATPSERLSGQLVAEAGRGGGQVFAPDADAIDQTAEMVRQLTQSTGGFAPLDENMCKNEPLITPAELEKVDPLVRPADAPVIPRLGGFHGMDADEMRRLMAIPASELIPFPSGRGQGEGDVTGVDLPQYVGGDTFLPEPPAAMVIAGYAVLGGAVAATGALMVLVPEVALISLSLPELAPIPAVAF